ncbi:MAG: inositol monophosphatase [Deltaproteobacteria bacterium]|nr:inositol monophosphatase [Deltaproteobacteria bacterium]
MPSKLFTEIAEISRNAALRAGEALKKRYGTVFTISIKPDAGLLTEVDLESEEIIISEIRKTRPADAILAEESGIVSELRGESSFRWIIDPLDGTTNFAHGVPHFAVSIGVEYEGNVVSGVVFNPMTGELFEAVKGKGATLNGKSVHVSGAEQIEESLLATGFSYQKGEIVDQELAVLSRVLHHVRAVRRIGSAALDLCYVAVGRFDGFWEYDLSPWDIAAGVLLVTEAGGKVSSMSGGPYLLEEGSIVASNGKIHQTLIEMLR